MNSIPEDLPTLRQHYSHFYINQKEIPILYRYKAGVYYPYVAFELVIDDLLGSCLTWSFSDKLPLLSMTLNERNLYQSLCPNRNFSTSSKLILCSLIDQYFQLVQYLQGKQEKDNEKSRTFARLKIDIEHGTLQEIDILNCEATSKYNYLRSIEFPSMFSVKRRLCFEEDNIQLSSIGGFLQLDRFIYPYILIQSDILLNFNDLRKPFSSTINDLLPFFHDQSTEIIENYKQIVSCGTRYIKKYNYYYKDIDHRFISLQNLLLLHESFIFVQLFNSKQISLVSLHEYYRSDFSHLLTKNLSHCGYINHQPFINGWSLLDLKQDNYRDCTSRLSTINEILLINWLLIYDHQEVHVHQQVHRPVLVKQSSDVVKEKLVLINDKHIQKRAFLTKNPTR